MHLKLQCKQDALPYQYIADSIETSLHLSQSEQSVVKKKNVRIHIHRARL